MHDRDLARRSTEGGSYLVQASLCQTAGWIVAQGPDCDPATATGLGELGPWMVESDTSAGRLRHLGPVVEMTATPAYWERPSPPLGTDSAAWV